MLKSKVLWKDDDNIVVFCISDVFWGYFQNGRFTNIDYVDENLSALQVSTEFLLKVSLASCGHAPVEEQPVDCTAPGALMTDFNIWDRAMGDIELIHWTSCQ